MIYVRPRLSTGHRLPMRLSGLPNVLKTPPEGEVLARPIKFTQLAGDPLCPRVACGWICVAFLNAKPVAVTLEKA